MNFLGLNLQISRSRSTVAAPPEQRAYELTPEEFLRGEDLPPRGPGLSSAYEQVVWVYRAINVLAEQVANIPFLFSAGDRGRENLITSGPLADFYAQPHPQINAFQYWELRVIWLMLRGECVRVPVFSPHPNPNRNPNPNPPRRLQRILILDPAHFEHIVEDGQLIGWRYRSGDPASPLADQVFLPEEIWFEKLPNPFDFWRGLSPLRSATLAAQTDFAAAAFMRGIIENNGDAGTIVRTENPLTKEQRAQLLAQLRQRKSRAGVADRPIVLSGCTEIVQPKLSSSDLQFLENRKFSRAEICAAFGVPEEIVTTTDHAKYDVMTGARLNFIENRVGPLCRRLEAGERPVVRALDPAAAGWFDLDSLPILQQARRSRLEAARAGFEMGLPFNELNRVLDLGFRALPWGDRGYVRREFTEVGREESSQDRTSGAGEGERARAELGESVLPELTLPEKLECLLLGNGSDVSDSCDASDPGAADDLAPFSAKLSRRFRRFLFEQRGRLLKAVSERPWEAQEILETVPGLEAERQRLDELLAPVIEELLEAAGPAPATLDLDHRLERLRNRMRDLAEFTLAQVRHALREGFYLHADRERLLAQLKAIYNHAAKGEFRL